VAQSVRSPLSTGVRSFAWVGVASLNTDTELNRPLSGGGLEASTDTLAP
jgi:hypothetical protein